MGKEEALNETEIEAGSGLVGDDASEEEVQALIAKWCGKDGGANAALKCGLCGAADDEAVLTGIFEGRTVSKNQVGVKIECLNLGECRVRRGVGNVHQNAWDHSGGYTGGVTYTSPKCRHEATEAFSVGEVHFYGGSEWKVEKQNFSPSEWLVVSMLGKSYSTKDLLWSPNPAWVKELLPFTYKSGFNPQISIDWPDYGIPPVKPGFWSKLLNMAQKQKLTNILFFCMGGHGRTGTALAAVLVEVCDFSAAQAVKFVREAYCKEAIESKSQTEYLISLQGGK